MIDLGQSINIVERDQGTSGEQGVGAVEPKKRYRYRIGSGSAVGLLTGSESKSKTLSDSRRSQVGGTALTVCKEHIGRGTCGRMANPYCLKPRAAKGGAHLVPISRRFLGAWVGGRCQMSPSLWGHMISKVRASIYFLHACIAPEYKVKCGLELLKQCWIVYVIDLRNRRGYQAGQLGITAYSSYLFFSLSVNIALRKRRNSQHWSARPETVSRLRLFESL